MNVVYPEENPITARTCGCKERNRQRVIYALSEDFHSLCMDKKYIIQAEIEACERLLKYTINPSERLIIEKEISELRSALDLMP
jgi:hypothetical protein